VKFFDTTLRDGEQTPGISITPDKKIQIARALDQLGVEVIEAGFAAVSPGEFEAVKLVSAEGLEAEICSATRGVIRDIDRAIEAGVDSVNLIIPTSDLHIETKLGKTRGQVLEIMGEAVSHGKDHGLIVETSLEDASRSDRNFLKQMITKSIDSGLDRATICDTVGILNPESAYELFADIKKEFPKIILGVHCHNDFGLGVANSLAALRAGADQVHATVNGMGERAGNASLEEVAVALSVMYEVENSIRLHRIYETSRLVSSLTGLFIQPNKAIVGANAFAHESGIHTHAISKDPLTYEAFNPELVGAARQFVSGKHTGSTGLLNSLQHIGYNPSDEEFEEILGRIKNLGDNGVRISDVDLAVIAGEVIGKEIERFIELDEFIVVTGNKITPTASVKMTLKGEPVIEAATGNGPVDSTLNAVSKAINMGEDVYLDTYHVKAVTGGTDAMVNVEIRIRQGERIVNSVGVNEDIVRASVDAYLKGLNVLMSRNVQDTTGKNS
jgi:D-citramalate synthase